MKSIIYAVAAASVLSMPLVAFAQAQTNQPLTRAEVQADLVRVEQAGYHPTANDLNYPSDIQAAEQRVAEQQGAAAGNSGVGGAAGATQSGASARPTNVDGVHPLYFGR